MNEMNEMNEMNDMNESRFRFKVNQRPGQLLQRARARIQQPLLRPLAAFPGLAHSVTSGFGGVGFVGAGGGSDGGSDGGASGNGTSGGGVSDGENADGGPRTGDGLHNVESMLSDVPGLSFSNKECRKGWLSGLKRWTVNILILIIVDSNPAPFAHKRLSSSC
jgi:hypothetical protein